MAVEFDIPSDRYFDREQHLWLHHVAGEPVRVGMDALGVASLGNLVFVAVADAGTRVTRGDALGTLEAEKMTSRLLASISGTIVDRNGEVLRDPSLVNRDPHEGGWLFRIEPADWDGDSEHLLSGDDIAPWVDAEIERYQAEGWIE